MKVVQGLEPENTNAFLLALARCAKNGNIDSAAAVGRTLRGETPGQGPPPVRGGPSMMADAKAESYPENQSKLGNMFDPDAGARVSGKDDKGYDSKGVVEAALESNGLSERGKSRGGTRGGKPTQQSGSGAGLTVGSNRPAFIDSEIEKCDGNMELTKELIGALIQKPKMADKLLGKPPFRFLHDTISEIIRVTGFANGLYTDYELDSANIDDKDKKIDFLQKIITLVGAHLSTLVEAKPSKIVAGQEPQNTNRFLQLLALAATHIPDSTSSVRSVLESAGGAPPEPLVAARAAPIAEPPKAEQKEKRSVKPQVLIY